MDTLVFIAAALVPLIFGAIWYNPNFGFGKAWLKASNITNKYARGANMPVIMGFMLLFSLMLTLSLTRSTIHQNAFESLFYGEPALSDANSETGKYIADFYEKYGEKHRSFKHGAIHGMLNGLFMALPFIASGALFERRGFKYIAIHAGYWTICCAIMGGIICAFYKT